MQCIISKHWTGSIRGLIHWPFQSHLSVTVTSDNISLPTLSVKGEDIDGGQGWNQSMTLCNQSTEDQQGHCSQRLRHTRPLGTDLSFDHSRCGQKGTRQGKFGPVLRWRVCASCLGLWNSPAGLGWQGSSPSAGLPDFLPSLRAQNARRKLAPNQQSETITAF